MRKAKIVCTIGPASSSKNNLEKLIKAGMNVARLNFSHGSHESHGKTVRLIRECSRRMGAPVAILQDLRGLKIRIGRLRNETYSLKRGATVFLRQSKVQKRDNEIPIPYSGLVGDVKVGNLVLFNDGMIRLKVISKEQQRLRTRVIDGGEIREGKGVNLPGTMISGDVFTKKDRDDLLFGLKAGVDYVAMSFVRTGQDIKKIKNWIKRHGADIPVIAKIENAMAIKNMDSIINEADGIMVARGDLGVEIPLESVPLMQKELISKSNKTMKPVITATQMLESMTTHMSPTRAEVADVANAVIDGTDALMLSAETSIGNYPECSVQMMEKIITTTEKDSIFDHAQIMESGDFPQALAEVACSSSRDINARTIVTFSRSGFTALLVSKYRPSVPITGFTVREEVRRRMCLYWGVSPFLMSYPKNTDDMISESEKALLKHQLVRKGDSVVIIAASPFTLGGKSNILKLHKVGY